MKLTRSLPAALLAPVLVLTACASDDDPSEGTATPDADSVTETATATAGPDTGDSTDGPTDDIGDATEGPTDRPTSGPAVTTSASITADEAQDIIDDLLGSAADSLEATGDEAEELRQEAFAGSELRAQRAARRIERLTNADPQYVFDPDAEDAVVIAISRRELYGETVPPFFLAQSVPDDGVPVLHLVSYIEDAEDYRIVWQAPMLPGTELEEFHALSLGSPAREPRSGAGLQSSPRWYLITFANALGYPEPGDSGALETGPYLNELQSQFEDQEASVSDHATFEQDHTLREGAVRVFDLPDGSAMAFGVVTRDSQFNVSEGQQLEAPTIVQAFIDTSVLYDQAAVETSVFVAFHVPEESPAEMVAVREQIVGASGE